MKRIFTFLAAALITASVFAQSPQKMSYQAIIRNSNNALVASSTVGMRISIFQGSATGTAVYTETQTTTTNANGLVSIDIGGQEGFDIINWASGVYFIKTETDPTGGSNYTITGTSQLLSVPYAIYATKAGNGLDYTTNPKAGDIFYSNGTNWELLPIGVNGQTLRLDNGLPNWGEPGYALPLVTTVTATDIMVSAAKSGGNVISTGYTEITGKGVCWNTTQNPTIENGKTSDGTGIGSYISDMKDLLPNTIYYARAYATNSAGTGYGNQITFKTFQTVVFPTVTTAAAINITETSAASGGNLTATGGAEVIAKGICWSNNQNPTVADSKTDEGPNVGQFNSQMDNLIPGSKYYLRAYATNSAGTGYGAQVTLTTLKTPPTVVTKNITSITPMGGVSGGTITLSGGGTISDKGICWGESENPTINDNKIPAGTGIATFNSAISLLKPNTKVYVKAYAVNELGIAYGDQKSFTSSDAFYDGFETGFSGISGGWGIKTDDAVEGSYALNTTVNNSEASLTRTLLNSGQVNFYAKTIPTYSHLGVSILFYIDNVQIGNYSNTFWGLQSYPVSAGEHTFKWKFTYSGQALGAAWIDFIVMPK